MEKNFKLYFNAPFVSVRIFQKLICCFFALVLFNPVFNNGPGNYGYDRFKDRYTEISPYHNIQKGAAPAIIFLGTEDKLIPVQTAVDYKNKMIEAGSKCELHLYKGQGHGFFNYKEAGNPFYQETVAEAYIFLKKLWQLP